MPSVDDDAAVIIPDSMTDNSISVPQDIISPPVITLNPTGQMDLEQHRSDINHSSTVPHQLEIRHNDTHTGPIPNDRREEESVRDDDSSWPSSNVKTEPALMDTSAETEVEQMTTVSRPIESVNDQVFDHLLNTSELEDLLGDSVLEDDQDDRGTVRRSGRARPGGRGPIYNEKQAEKAAWAEAKEKRR